jgi:hypothetical protein
MTRGKNVAFFTKEGCFANIRIIDILSKDLWSKEHRGLIDASANPFIFRDEN